MMSMLTIVVILVAIGTMVQRVDFFERFFDGGTVALELRRDEAIVRANALSSINVLANDLGIKDSDAGKLIVTEQPACGRVFVRNGQAQYLPAERCVGSQSFKYALSGRSYGQAGEVIVIVRLGEPTQNEVAADAQRDIPAPAPMVPRAGEQRVGDTPALLAEQPTAGANAGGTIIQAARVPRPQAPEIGGLPETASSAGGSSTAGISLEGAGLAPTMTAPASNLSRAPLPDPAAPVQSAPLQAEPVQAAPTPMTPAQPAQLPTESSNGQATSIGAVDGGAAGGTQDEAAATVAVARIDPTQAPALDLAPTLGSPTLGPPTLGPPTLGPPTLGAAGETAALGIQRGNDGDVAVVPRTTPPEIGAGESGQAGLGQPAEALAAVRGLGEAAELAPVNTASPGVLSDPGAVPAPGTGQAGSGQTGSGQPEAPCVVPPGLILDVKPAGVTEVIIESPCHARTVAELSYDGLRFGVALDAAGTGTIAAIGLQQASDATLRFADGESLEFNIPFADTERMERVVLAWEMPVDLGLHAFEFGALPQSSGHVRPKYPRSYGEVRRHGGGYLLEYRPVNGVNGVSGVGEVGQSLNVYTYWHRHDGRSGVVKLKLDFTSRDGRKRPDTCGGGTLSEPDFTVIRSVAGKLERIRRGRLASLDCAIIAGTVDRYIGDAVDDMVVRQR
jgi:hypothetical protein